MDIREIIAELRAERDRLNQAIAAIEAIDSTGNSFGRRARPASTATPTPFAKPRGRRRMTAAARKRISEARKQWWAQRRKKSGQPRAGANKNALTLAAPKRRGRISAAARKKLAMLMKQRWASGKMGKVKKTA